MRARGIEVLTPRLGRRSDPWMDAVSWRRMGRRFTTLAAFAVLFGIAILGARRMRLDFALDRVLTASSEEVEEVRAMHERLPWIRPNRLLAVSFPQPATRADLRMTENLASVLERSERTDMVISLGRVPVMRSGSVLPLAFAATLPDDDEAPVVVEAWKHPLFRGTLISENGKTLVLPLLTGDSVETLLGAAREVLGEKARARVIGSSVVLASLREKLESSLVRVLGLEVLLFAILLPLLFRTLRGSVLPLAVVLVSVLFNFAWMGFFGQALTVLDVAIPGLVVIIGLADTIHLMQSFEENYAQSEDRAHAIRAMLRAVGRACLYTSFTTAVGFLSLVVTDHETVSAFGLKAAISVVVTFLVVITLLPALLSVLPLGSPRPPRSVGASWLGYGRPLLVLCVLGLALCVTGFGISRVSVNSFLLEEIPASDPISQDLHWYEREVSGILDIEARVVGDLTNPRNFAALEALQGRLLEEDGLTRVESITLFVREALGKNTGALDAGDLARGIARLRAARDALPVRHLVDADFGLARIVFKSRDVGLTRMNEYRSLIEELAAPLAPRLKIEGAGYVLMANRSTELVVRSMLESLGLSILVIAFFLAVLLRSLRLALAALLSNVLPLAVALGVSGLLGIHVTIGSAIIYCLGLGLAVDDSIHILSRYGYEKGEDPGASKRALLTRTLRSSGKALILTSAVLAIGTLCHLAADFQTLHNVGILLTVIVVAALVVDLWVLPFLVERFDADEAAATPDTIPETPR